MEIGSESCQLYWRLQAFLPALFAADAGRAVPLPCTPVALGAFSGGLALLRPKNYMYYSFWHTSAATKDPGIVSTLRAPNCPLSAAGFAHEPRRIIARGYARSPRSVAPEFEPSFRSWTSLDPWLAHSMLSPAANCVGSGGTWEDCDGISLPCPPCFGPRT